MRYLFYHHSNGVLIIKYHDDFGNHITQHYLFYTVKEAISKFRKDNGLQRKHIVIKQLA